MGASVVVALTTQSVELVLMSFDRPLVPLDLSIDVVRGAGRSEVCLTSRDQLAWDSDRMAGVPAGGWVG